MLGYYVLCSSLSSYILFSGQARRQNCSRLWETLKLDQFRSHFLEKILSVKGQNIYDAYLRKSTALKTSIRV